ncbi:TPA: hypothetical protein ACX6NQ_003705 [Photobacterium damselae]
MKVLILGGKGFVGNSIKRYLEDKGLYCEIKGRENIDLLQKEFDLLIDATSQKSHEIKKHVTELEKLVINYNIRKTIIISSFSTLQSSLKNEDLLFMGANTKFFTPYTRIKYLKELLIDKSNILREKNVKFLYLPIIIGDNGTWSEIINRATESTIVPYIENLYVINNNMIGMAVEKLFYSNSTRAVAFDKIYRGFPELFDLNLSEVTSEKFNRNFINRFLNYLFTYKSYLFTLSSYVISFVYMKLRYKKSCPSYFYWGLFYSQSKMIDELSSFNILSDFND